MKTCGLITNTGAIGISFSAIWSVSDKKCAAKPEPFGSDVLPRVGFRDTHRYSRPSFSVKVTPETKKEVTEPSNRVTETKEKVTPASNEVTELEKEFSVGRDEAGEAEKEVSKMKKEVTKWRGEASEFANEVAPPREEVTQRTSEAAGSTGGKIEARASR